jgi:murein DD-endopeptidase MepM/ murein hydrolase activator NlpD
VADVGGRVSGSGLRWPMGGSVTSEFGYRWGRLHAGVDIGGGTGTPIRAAKEGTVIFSGNQGGYGNVVIIDHGGGLTTLYAHQSRRAVADGAEVNSGDVIGYVGSTGHSTGPHLHFETRSSGSPQNPRRYLP